MDEVQKGYIFKTVFWVEKDEDGTPRLVAEHINGKLSEKKIVCDDRRVMPGQTCKVKVESMSEKAIQVSYLGLVDFTLQEEIYIDPVLLDQFEILLASGRSILLEGPQGTGKTTISRVIAESLGMEYVFFNCSVCFEPADFAGTLQLVVDGNGQAKPEWVSTDVLKAIHEANEMPEKRYLVFLDELNRTRSYALNGIMSAIDSSKRIFDPTVNSYIPIPDNIQWIAAINSGRQFTGTFKLDLAQYDRFSILKLDYPPVDEEVNLLSGKYPMLNKKHIRKIVDTAHSVRTEPSVLTDLSVRATDEACMFLSYPTKQRGFTNQDLVDILKTAFCNRLPGDTGEEGTEAAAAYRLIEQHVFVPEAVDENNK